MAGAAIVVTTVAILATIAITQTLTQSSSARGSAGSDTPTDAVADAADEGAPPTHDGLVMVRALATTNMYASPARSSELVAILPGTQVAEAEAQTPEGDWLLVIFPPGSSQRGWIPSTIVEPEEGSLTSLSIEQADTVRVAAPPPGATVGAADVPAAQVDLSIGEVFVLGDGRIALSLRNEGTALLVAQLVPLRITAAEGDILGVLRIGPATIAAGAVATAVTPVVVESAGSFRLIVDSGNEIAELDEFNNSRDVLLFPPGRDE